MKLKRLLYEKRKELGDSANKLKNGLFKITDTRIKVEQMSVQLEANKAKAAQFQKECEDYLVILVKILDCKTIQGNQNEKKHEVKVPIFLPKFSHLKNKRLKMVKFLVNLV